MWKPQLVLVPKLTTRVTHGYTDIQILSLVSCILYIWSPDDLGLIEIALNDSESSFHHNKFIDNMLYLSDINATVTSFNNCITQACDRVLEVIKVRGSQPSKAPRWYDVRCRIKRSDALKACQRANHENSDYEKAIAVCKDYKSMRQRKKRQYKRTCISEIEAAFHNKAEMWDVISKFS